MGSPQPFALLVSENIHYFPGAVPILVMFGDEAVVVSDVDPNSPAAQAGLPGNADDTSHGMYSTPPR